MKVRDRIADIQKLVSNPFTRLWCAADMGVIMSTSG
jgi:hypothetical protein